MAGISTVRGRFEHLNCRPEDVYTVSGRAKHCIVYIDFKFTGELSYRTARLDSGVSEALILPRGLFNEVRDERKVGGVNNHHCLRYGTDIMPFGIADLLVPARNSTGQEIEVPLNNVVVAGVDRRYIRDEPVAGIGFLQGFMRVPFSIVWEDNRFEIALVPKEPAKSASES
ncbi:MAG: hypothetical protein HY512_00105 [Candidatus Aenigmarchaeota archaeon]|nr:hypothetical protein [Candidatus Aenigmarchaeota archaeon]